MKEIEQAISDKSSAHIVKGKKRIITRAQQRVGFPLMSKVKLETPVRSRVVKPITRVTKQKDTKIQIILGTILQNLNDFKY